MVPQYCAGCDEESSDMKRCSGCKKVWYCSTRWQKGHWSTHIFDCKTGQPLSTVYHLARAMVQDVAPVDQQTRIDYGFDKAQRMIGGHSESMLCGLYQGVLHALGVTPKELRRWQREGTLVDGIKRSFEAYPPDNRGGYYPWFLQHQYILDGTPVDEDAEKMRSEHEYQTMLRQGWAYAGGSPHATIEEILSQTGKFPLEKQECFQFCSMLLVRAHPNPFMKSYLSFGFVASSCAGEEQQYHREYQDLLARCTFDEFCNAYASSVIPALFKRYNIPLGDNPKFRDVMTPPLGRGTNKSVWDLKQYVDQLASSQADNPPAPVRSVVCDYGFANCKDTSERKLLDDLYKKLFGLFGMDPLALHEACIKGELLEFAKKHVKLAPWTAKYTRLLKNPYPLLDSGSTMSVDHCLSKPSYSLVWLCLGSSQWFEGAPFC